MGLWDCGWCPYLWLGLGLRRPFQPNSFCGSVVLWKLSCFHNAPLTQSTSCRDDPYHQPARADLRTAAHVCCAAVKAQCEPFLYREMKRLQLASDPCETCAMNTVQRRVSGACWGMSCNWVNREFLLHKEQDASHASKVILHNKTSRQQLAHC